MNDEWEWEITRDREWETGSKEQGTENRGRGTWKEYR